jgi:hypothetical protein
MTEPGCTHRTVAARRHCSVQCCEHGGVHLNLGSLTLRLSPEQLASIADTLAAAAHALEAERDRRGLRLC